MLYPVATVPAHIVFVIFIIMLATKQNGSQKVNHQNFFDISGTYFGTYFEKNKIPVASGPHHPNQELSGNSISGSELSSVSNAINQIAASFSNIPSHSSPQTSISPATSPRNGFHGQSNTYYQNSPHIRNLSPTVAHSYGFQTSQTTNREQDHVQDNYSLQIGQEYCDLPDLRRAPASLNETFESSHFQPARTEPMFPEMEEYKASLGQEMEWTPTRPDQSQYRAFQPLSADPPKNQLFGQTPTTTAEQSSVFWAKIPPAPVAPAHRLRNPPNQPRLRVASQEVKENFFKSLTQRDPITYGVSGKNDRRHLDFAQQRFFPPENNNDEADAVTDMLSKWDLSLSPEPEAEIIYTARPVVLKHLGRSFFLGLGFWLWHDAANLAFIDSWNCMMAVLVLCLCMATWIMLNYTHVTKEEKAHQSALYMLGLLYGGVNFMAILWLMTKLHLERENCTDCASFGELIIGPMIIHELCRAFFAGDQGVTIHRRR